jgi:glycosyltransferase involved in cell wall biosynthesis
VPAFIASDETPNRANSKRREADVTIVCSGYGTRVYNWEEVLEAIGPCPDSCRWVCCFYTSFEPGYYDNVRAKLDRCGNVVCFENLGASEFLRILAAGTVFLRPTTRDGDAVSVREALASGIPCVASDVVARPQGTLLYRLGDGTSLTNTLMAAVEHREGVASAPSDFGQTVIDLYEDVWQRSGRPWANRPA